MKRKILLLPGNSEKNIIWLKKIIGKLNDKYNIVDIKYDHWHQNKSIDFDLETEKIRNRCCKDEEYFVVSKSIGSILALKVINNKIIKPKFMVIMGFPLKYMEEENISILSSILSISKYTKILFIQQKNDPLCTCKELMNYLPNNMEVVEISGNDHFYGNVETIEPIINKFYNSKKTK